MAIWQWAMMAAQAGTAALIKPVMFPWFNDTQATWIYNKTKDEQDEKLKKQKEYELYKQMLPVAMANKKLDDRIEAKKELVYQSTQEKDLEKKSQMDLTLKMADFADQAREYGLKNGKDLTNIPDNEVIGAIIKAVPNGAKMFEDYMNNGDDSLLVQAGIKQPKIEKENEYATGLLDFLSWKRISTEREVGQFLDPLWMKGTGWADPWTALNLVGKSLLNLVPNAVSFVKWVGSMIFHPKQTVEWIKSIGQGIIDQSQWQTDTPQAQMVAGMRDWIKNTVTDPQALWQFLFENPLDVLTVVSPKGVTDLWVASVKLAGKSVAKSAEVIGKWTAKASEFIASQAFGIAPSTIKTIVRNPELYTQVERWIINSEELLGQLGGKIDSKIAKIWDTGKLYEQVKKIANIETPIEDINNVLYKRGIKINNGKLDFTDTNMADTSDLNAIQKAYDIVNTPNVNAINMRGKLDDLINYESKTTSKWQWVIKEIRKAIDDKAKTEIPWLAKLDATYWVEVKELRAIKKDFLNADWTFKDNALSKLSNLTKKWNEAKLERVKQLLPWIENNINAIRAFEDVTLAWWQKVGAYLRWAGTVWIGALTWWPVWAVVWLLLTSPQVATNLLKWLWYTKEFITKIVNKIRTWTKITQSEMAVLEKWAESLSTNKTDDLMDVTNMNNNTSLINKWLLSESIKNEIDNLKNISRNDLPMKSKEIESKLTTQEEFDYLNKVYSSLL